LTGETGFDETGGNKAKWTGAIVPVLKTQCLVVKADVWGEMEKSAAGL